MCGNSDDFMVRGTAAAGMIRALAVSSAETVRIAQRRHGTNALATVALGRLSTAALMMGALFKNDGERVALSVLCDGPLRGLTAVADTQGNVKGYAAEPEAVAEANAHACACGEVCACGPQPNVPAGIGMGTLAVVREIPHAEPFVSQIPLVNGTIFDDLIAYFMMSEQTPTIVGLDVLVDERGLPECAGGYLIQLMPGYDEDLPERLMAALSAAEPLEGMLRRKCAPDEMLNELLGGFGFAEYERMSVRFQCDCSREFAERTLLSLGADGLRELAESGEPAEIVCDYCSERYVFTVQQLRSLILELHGRGAAEG